MSALSFSADIQTVLLDVASASLAHGVEAGAALAVSADKYPQAVRNHTASFVTLRHGTDLRGCMGSLESRRPLVEDVAGNAYSAGFRDPRFTPLQRDELTSLSISVSVLSPPEPVAVASERELLELMGGRAHGWILQHGQRRGLLLPAVWKSVCDPQEFLAHLKAKARLQPEFWSPEVVVERFAAASFGPRRASRPDDRTPAD